MKILVVMMAAVGLCLGGPVDPQPRIFIYQVGSPSVRRYPVYPDRLLQPPPDQLKMAMEAIRLSIQPQENQRFNPNMLKPKLTKPEMMQPNFGRPEMMQPEMTKPEIMLPTFGKPERMKLGTTIPEMIETETLRPGVMETETLRPEVMEIETLRSEVMETETIRPGMVELETIRPEMVELETTTKPEIMEPETMRPELTEPETMKPEIMELETMRPEMIQLGTFKPETTQPEASAPLTDPPMSLGEAEQVDSFTNQSSMEAAGGSLAAAAATADSSPVEEAFLTQPITVGDMETLAELTEESEVGGWLTTMSPFGEMDELERPLDEVRETFQPPVTVTISEDLQDLTETIQEESATEFFNTTENEALFTSA